MRILLHRNFEKKFVKLSKKVTERFQERRNLFLTDPFHPLLNNHPLTGSRTGQWSINVTGDWRVIYLLQDAATVIFIDIDTHSNLYS